VSWGTVGKWGLRIGTAGIGWLVERLWDRSLRKHVPKHAAELVERAAKGAADCPQELRAAVERAARQHVEAELGKLKRVSDDLTRSIERGLERVDELNSRLARERGGR